MVITKLQSKHTLSFVVFFGGFMSCDLLTAFENIPFKNR